jgi:hypothetical protein
MSLVAETFLDLLEQDVVWRTSDGRSLAVTQMEHAHRRAVLRMLEGMAGDLYAERCDELLNEGFTPEELADAGFEIPDPFFDDGLSPAAVGWFVRQPLVARLRVLIDHDSANGCCESSNDSPITLTP